MPLALPRHETDRTMRTRPPRAPERLPAESSCGRPRRNPMDGADRESSACFQVLQRTCFEAGRSRDTTFDDLRLNRQLITTTLYDFRCARSMRDDALREKRA